MFRGLVFLLLAVTSMACARDLEQARKLYNRTDYEGALAALEALPQKNAEVYGLMGRSLYMKGEFKKASEAYEKALAAEPSSSTYAHWLGKAYGKRAETASPFTAPGYASKTRQNFEKAVALDPKNIEAMNDLMEYYLQAPGFLGGGFGKAVSLAEKIAAADKIEGYYAQARLAEKRKEYGAAGEQLRRAAEMAPMQLGRVVDLAKFLAKQGKYQESEQAFRKAEKIDPNSPKLLFARAETYVRSRRNLETARTLLKKYLAAPLTPEDPARYEAEKLLKEAGG